MENCCDYMRHLCTWSLIISNICRYMSLPGRKLDYLHENLFYPSTKQNKSTTINSGNVLVHQKTYELSLLFTQYNKNSLNKHWMRVRVICSPTIDKKIHTCIDITRVSYKIEIYI